MQCDTSAASFSEVFSQMRSLPDAIEPQTVGADIAEKYRLVVHMLAILVQKYLVHLPI